MSGPAKFKPSEDEVHAKLYELGLEAVVADAPLFDGDGAPGDDDLAIVDSEAFELWRIIKARTLAKIARIHRSVRYGHFIGSKVKLPIDSTQPMELDLLGQHEDGLFILELKVDRSAERNAFSELFAYSNYMASIFAMSSAKDIVNILVAPLDVKITRQAYLYDLLVADRNVVVYQPDFPDGSLNSLRLSLYIPSDDEFRHFTNQLLSHEAMACCAVSFHDIPDWIDSKEEDGSLNDHTRNHLRGMSVYAAQLMEAEHLHGFCFVRKPWEEIPRYYRNTLFICALNPFRMARPERADLIVDQLDEEHRTSFKESPELGFDGRLTAVARRVIKDTLTHNFSCELELPFWGSIVQTGQEVVYTHNLGFHATGLMREAYVGYLTSIYAAEVTGEAVEDVSVLKVDELENWYRAWRFMEACGFTTDEPFDS